MNNWLSAWAIVTLNTSNCMYDWWQHSNTFVVRVYCIQYVCLFIFCLNILKVYICLDNNSKRLNMDITSPCMCLMTLIFDAKTFALNILSWRHSSFKSVCEYLVFFVSSIIRTYTIWYIDVQTASALGLILFICKEVSVFKRLLARHLSRWE